MEHDDCYDVIGFTGSVGITGAQTSVVGQAHINITPYHTLYIHSTLGTQADSVGPMGSSSVIRTVCLDQPVGRYVHDRNSLPFDYVSVAKGMIRQLDFKLTDWRGRTRAKSPGRDKPGNNRKDTGAPYSRRAPATRGFPGWRARNSRRLSAKIPHTNIANSSINL